MLIQITAFVDVLCCAESPRYPSGMWKSAIAESH
jgi:hypothetical protein